VHTRGHLKGITLSQSVRSGFERVVSFRSESVQIPGLRFPVSIGALPFLSLLLLPLLAADVLPITENELPIDSRFFASEPIRLRFSEFLLLDFSLLERQSISLVALSSMSGKRLFRTSYFSCLGLRGFIRSGLLVSVVRLSLSFSLSVYLSSTSYISTEYNDAASSSRFRTTLPSQNLESMVGPTRYRSHYSYSTALWRALVALHGSMDRRHSLDDSMYRVLLLRIVRFFPDPLFLATN